MNNKLLNWIFIIELILFGLIVTGVLPRSVVPYLAIALIVYVLLTSLEDATVFFVRSIPFFLAIPITATFDNFNTWRILAGIIFLKWLWLPVSSLQFTVYRKSSASQFSKKLFTIHYSLFTRLLLLLLLFAFLSIIPAPDKMIAVKRIIYFLNLSLIGFVIYDLAQKEGFAKRLIKNISVPVIIVTIVGFAQLVSTYFIDIYQFMRTWGEGIQCRQFGEQWCNIAVQVGNTWFAYYGEQLSLRVFSLFPDSHSFPQFVLLGIPAVLAITQRRWVRIVSLSTLFLIIILSGTRGIWAASIGVVLLVFMIMFWNRRIGVEKEKIILFKKTASYLAVFFTMFAIAFPIFSSPQFLIGKSDDFLKNRIRSIIDFGETSNSQRIAIWKASLESIKKHPLLGVGVGNFPVVLNQDLALAKAGSSAHNVYLHIAAEMGMPALIFALWFLWLLIQKTYKNFISSKDWEIIIYNGAALIFVPWILIYSLTDVALFDERAFLLFVTTTSLILANKPGSESSRY